MNHQSENELDRRPLVLVGQRSSPCCSGGGATHRSARNLTQSPPPRNWPPALPSSSQPGRCRSRAGLRRQQLNFGSHHQASSPASHRRVAGQQLAHNPSHAPDSRLPHAPLIPPFSPNRHVCPAPSAPCLAPQRSAPSRQTDVFVQPPPHPALHQCAAPPLGRRLRALPSHAGACRTTPITTPAADLHPTAFDRARLQRLLVFAVDHRAADRELSHPPSPVRQPGGSLHHTTAVSRNPRGPCAAMSAGSTASHFIAAKDRRPNR